jgi:hypothetical protein
MAGVSKRLRMRTVVSSSDADPAYMRGRRAHEQPLGRAQHHDRAADAPLLVSGAFFIFDAVRSILTEIYICHICSGQEIEDGSASAGQSCRCIRWRRASGWCTTTRSM